MRTTQHSRNDTGADCFHRARLLWQSDVCGRLGAESRSIVLPGDEHLPPQEARQESDAIPFRNAGCGDDIVDRHRSRDSRKQLEGRKRQEPLHGIGGRTEPDEPAPRSESCRKDGVEEWHGGRHHGERSRIVPPYGKVEQILGAPNCVIEIGLGEAPASGHEEATGVPHTSWAFVSRRAGVHAVPRHHRPHTYAFGFVWRSPKGSSIPPSPIM
jgi:hypothetical protein